MEWGAAIGGLFAVVGMLLKAYLAKAPQRQEESKADAIQEGRQDIVSGDADAVAARIDRVLEQDSGNAGSASVPNPAGRASTIQRLARLGIHVVKTPRGGRTPLN